MSTNVLITGAAGFLGSHLAEYLAEQATMRRFRNGTDVQLTLLVKPDNRASDNLRYLEGMEGVSIEPCDLRNAGRTSFLFAGQDQVYHLAARIGGVGYLRDNPAEIITENDAINRTVFDCCVKAGVDRLLYASSSMVYARATTFPTFEKDVEDLPPPPGQYGFQKLNGERYCQAYAEAHGLEFVAPRIFNAVGPRDWPAEKVGVGHVIPDLTKKIDKVGQDPLMVKGSGRQTRCFTDVRDMIRGLKLCMETDEAAGEFINLGSTEEVSIRDLAACIWRVAGREGQLNIRTESSFQKDVQRRVPSTEKAERVLGWTCEHSLEETVRVYVQAYRQKLEAE